MPEGYEDIFDIDSLDDEELEELITQELDEHPEIDPDLVEIVVESGFVTLRGRVGTEQERQVLDQLVGDVLGIETYTNEIVLDELVRGERSPAADESYAEAGEIGDPMLGDSGDVTDPQADHLIEDSESELYGTSDMQAAVERGYSYNPPSRPIQDGSRSEENH